MSIIRDSILGDCYDVLAGKSRDIKINDASTVSLVDCTPRLCPTGRTCEYAIVRAARVSYGLGMKTPEQDKRLIDYLIRHYHTSPFEFVQFTFRIECPIFVARQIMRHRTFSFNEHSARYSEMKDRFYLPTEFGTQDTVNKQGSINTELTNDKVDTLQQYYKETYDMAYTNYQKLIDNGISREQARILLPVGIVTEMYATVDLGNLLKFLRLRMDEHTQKETRDIANAMYELVKQVIPTVIESWDTHNRLSVTFSSREVECIKRDISMGDAYPNTSINERNEFTNKYKKIKPDSTTADTIKTDSISDTIIEIKL